MDDEWTVEASEAITISLVEPSRNDNRSGTGDANDDAVAGDGPNSLNGLNKIASFHPNFTYPLFGESERIFGFQGLKINLQFNASDLRPNLSISSSKKFATVGEVEATDVSSVMKEYLPTVAFQNTSDFQHAIRSIPSDWTPPGTNIKSYNRGREHYEIWKGSLADPAVRQLVKRIQITVLFFVEGGSYIGVDADGNDEPESSLARWSVYFLYKKEVGASANASASADAGAASGPKYVFQGYSTVYDFWMFQQPTPPATPEAGSSWELPETTIPLSDLPRRSRISQFIILPPFQRKGVGAFLYNTIFDLLVKDPFVKEVTIEDPNEAFDRLRDLCDIKYLRANEPKFANLSLSTDVPVPAKGGILHNNTEITLRGGSSQGGSRIIDTEVLEEIRVKHKIAPRQFSRLVEMHLMSLLPASVRPHATLPNAKRPAASQDDKHVYTLWKLLLKQRLYYRNAALLGEFEVTERILKLDETLGNVELEYAQILERLEETSTVTNGKRKLEASTEDGPSSKKVRVENA